MKLFLQYRLFLVIFSLFFLASSSSLIAQDIQFSQFYNVITYQNPAFAGSAHAPRVILHNRLQWPALDAKYVTYFVSADHYSNQYNSGVGLYVLKDVQGAKNISTTEVAAQYAYELPISHKLSVRAGLQASYSSRYLNYADLTFPHQYDDKGINDPNNGYALSNPRKGFIDLSSGGLLYTKYWWFGVSGHHLNTPNQSFNGAVARLPVKLAFTAGYKIPLLHKKYMAYMEEERDVSITPTAHYKMQGKSDQLDLGAYLRYDQIMVGLWYRGIPVKHYKYDADSLPQSTNYKRLQNNESMVVMIGWRYQSIAISYSYDFTVSKLAPYRTGGAHEFNITWVHHKHKKKHKPMKRLPCPSFH